MASIYVINREDNPSFKILWVLLIMAVPVMGGLFYILFGGRKVPKELRVRDQQSLQELRSVMKQNQEMAEVLREEEPDAFRQASFAWNSGYFPVYANCEVTYFPLGEDKFAALLQALRKAKRFIFLEYFIIAEGIMWNSVLDILKDKVKEGVDVRLIYDDAGCITTLPPDYCKTLRRYGIKAKLFNPIEPHLAMQMNNRDHRKIMVIDNRVAFTGGINLADEYINVKELHGHWKDTAIMLRGEAVWSLTVMFLTMWDFIKGEEADFDLYRPQVYQRELPPDDGYIQPFADNPLDDEPVGENVYLNMISRAKRYVYITTPYLIPSNEMMTALCNAARSGVDVRIITPHIPDKWYVHMVSRAHYSQLVEAGVRIFEYTPGFIHAKSFVADGLYAVVGTINLDYRSLFLHHECAVWMYKSSAVSGMKGVSSTDTMRSDSHRLYSTAARRGRFASSFASTHGAVSSIYLLARWMPLKISASACGSCRLSMHFVTAAGMAFTSCASSPSNSPAWRASGSVPPKYFSTMATVRDKRLPRSFAKSELMRAISASFENTPSLPKGISRRRK